MEKQGYIKLHRKFVDWEWYSDMPTRCTFEFLLIKANHKAKLFKGKTIERGATLTSYREISEKNGMSLQNARTALKHLKSTGEVTYEKMLNGLYIKVLNYDLYQSDNTTSNTQLTDNQHTTNIQLTTNKNDKNEKNEKNINTYAQSDCKQSSMLEAKTVISLTLNDKTEYSITEEKVNEWKELYPAVDVIQELRKMKGWLDANPSKRKTRRGILKFVNSWLSRAQDKGGSGNIQSRSSVNEYPEL